MAVKLLKTEVSSLLENIDYEMVNELELEAKLLRLSFLGPISASLKAGAL